MIMLIDEKVEIALQTNIGMCVRTNIETKLTLESLCNWKWKV